LLLHLIQRFYKVISLRLYRIIVPPLIIVPILLLRLQYVLHYLILVRGEKATLGGVGCGGVPPEEAARTLVRICLGQDTRGFLLEFAYVEEGNFFSLFALIFFEHYLRGTDHRTWLPSLCGCSWLRVEYAHVAQAFLDPWLGYHFLDC